VLSKEDTKALLDPANRLLEKMNNYKSMQSNSGMSQKYILEFEFMKNSLQKIKENCLLTRIFAIRED